MIWFSNEPLFGNTLSQLVTKEQLAKMDSTIKPVEVRSNINFAVTELNRDNCDQICCSFFSKTRSLCNPSKSLFYRHFSVSNYLAFLILI